MKEVYVISAVRTPIGSFGGVLSPFSATQLGGFAIKGAIEKAGIDPKEVQEVYMGNVVSANLGQAPATQAAVLGGLGYDIPSTTINKVCASGTKAIMLAAQSIMLGLADVIVAGGMESMTNIPFYVPKARFGYRYGNGEFLDGLVRDGLEDVYDKKAMGVFADATAKKYDISRQQQDEFAIRSYELAAEHTKNGAFKNEIIPVAVPQKKGDPVLLAEDEEYKNVMFDKIPTLKPAFTPDGTVTAANASKINDGAAALVLMSKEKAEKLGLKPIAKIVAFADAQQEPAWFTTAPTKAAPIAAKNAGISLNEIDLFEVNEAFAVVTLAFDKVLDIPLEKTNVMGGAVALGHPLGASGARIVTTLINALHQKDKKRGMVAICNGGGGASALIVEKV
ncbi:acetyl-CoA C-acyltransferase [Raineya orbicola]|jgi:acetyl-CoA C-acetyltransferase|uniref:acetyl-CoA C-acetyltransferase n=1 Tax=Raineya orbicola TaxID=2016530 RepID=A0A2N3IHQ8_9BACT|nr:acetyl-CoA C-acyltransferase [Raineya orbicola]PKQ69821.1 AcCoA-C-Actrans: acetyl-CoA C-acetyltransferase [Raineya orbicola]